MSNIVIFDLDGTLADCTHRVPLLPDWDAFYAACDRDSLIEPIGALYRHMHADWFNWDVRIWTGRRESERDKTLMWFDDHKLPLPDHQDPIGGESLLMRPDGDHRPDTELKLDWLTESIDRPLLVFEDRTSVVNMYRKQGIQVCQVAPGDF